MEDELISVPMSTLAERMALAFAHRQSIAEPDEKISQAGLARACNRKPPSVHAWFSGKTKELEGSNLLNAARYLGVRPRWLSEGRGSMLYDQDTEESRELLEALEDIDGANFSPMAKKLAKEFDQISDESIQLDVLVSCIAIITRYKDSSGT